MRDYTKQEKKELGAFYTPDILAEYLVKTILSLSNLNDDTDIYNVVDPSTGNSSLLRAFARKVSTTGLKINVLGLDIDNQAISNSKAVFEDMDNQFNFIETDALYPMDAPSPLIGWKKLKSKYLIKGIDFIVSNPPWGTDKNDYSTLSKDFVLAKGQFDIYDLFVETIIRELKDGGYYAIIVPDSIYSFEHKNTRKLILTETSLLKIVRLGEGFFQNVNTAVSILFGKKEKSMQYKVSCSHLTSFDKKQVINNQMNLSKAIRNCLVKVPIKLFIESDFAFITDVSKSDKELMTFLDNCQHISDVAISQRGIELSKKGAITQCYHCHKWFATPRKKDQQYKCPHCNLELNKDLCLCTSIISSAAAKHSKKIIVGEDITRYKTLCKSYIEEGYDGINYKQPELYKGSKILVRKTGVGITAGMDYDNCWTNQVVYILRRNNTCLQEITNEVILAVLNSRITTYYIIKRYGNNGWKTHPYLSQKDVGNLPFPIINIEKRLIKQLLNTITTLVRKASNQNEISAVIDAQLERCVALLFGVGEKEYDIVFNTIKAAQQMIPFKRLINITREQIFDNGI